MKRADSQRVVLVTGGANGIGRAAALLLAERGAALAIADRDADAGRRFASELEAAGAEALFFETDVSREESVVALLESVTERFGRLDGAFNNAGIADPQRSWLDFPTELWERMLAVNLTSVFLCMKHELALMSAQPPRDGLRGQIVNTASGAAYSTAPGQPHYTAAKSGVLGLTRSAAEEFAPRGIRVNTVCPGLTDTAILQEQPPELRQRVAQSSPTGEIAPPVDVAQAVVWLLSPESQWVNGQSLLVNGGSQFH